MAFIFTFKTHIIYRNLFIDNLSFTKKGNKGGIIMVEYGLIYVSSQFQDGRLQRKWK